MTYQMVDYLTGQLTRELTRNGRLEDRLSDIVRLCEAKLVEIEKHGGETVFVESVLKIARGER